jgi:hypothetical protein
VEKRIAEIFYSFRTYHYRVPLSAGTSKWNKIEHKLFSFISINWRGKPLLNYQTVINLISATTTIAGLRVFAVLDEHVYQLKQKVTDEEMKNIHLTPHTFHGEWNYTIAP